MSPRSLRYYEDEGLIVPGRCRNGYRDYCHTTLDRVLVVRSLLESGLPVRLIRDVLAPVADNPAAHSEPIDTEFLREVERYRDRLGLRIAALSAQHAALDTFLAVNTRQGNRTRA